MFDIATFSQFQGLFYSFIGILLVLYLVVPIILLNFKNIPSDVFVIWNRIRVIIVILFLIFACCDIGGKVFQNKVSNQDLQDGRQGVQDRLNSYERNHK